MINLIDLTQTIATPEKACCILFNEVVDNIDAFTILIEDKVD